jgi:hypothetical protein
MLSPKFGLIALGYGALCTSVLIASGISRFRRGKVVGAQFAVALTLVLSWVWSNLTYVHVAIPTIGDLSFPYLDVVMLTVLVMIKATYKSVHLWFNYLIASTIFQMLFHLPYMASGGMIMSKHNYHLTLNLIFASQNLANLMGLYIPRTKWMLAGKTLDNAWRRVQMPRIATISAVLNFR